jgi:putative ABC transport system permease protein
MNDLTLMRKNLFRKPVRTTLMLISILVAFLLFAVLGSFNALLGTVSAPPTRMVTLSKINFTQTLPISYYDDIARMPGIAAATHMNWFGGYYRDAQKGFQPTFAVDPSTFLRVYAREVPLTPQARDLFLHERRAMIVGESVARRFGWRAGQTVPLKSNIFSQSNGSDSWDFIVAGIFKGPPGTFQDNSVYIRYDYFNDTITFGKDQVGWIPFNTTSAAENERISHAIDARFANSHDETSTQDADSFNKSFAAQQGNIGLVVDLVVGAAFVAILLIVGTTMSLAIRERTKEIGVLKTLGFKGGRILRMVLGESVLLALIGAALGVGLAGLVIMGLRQARLPGLAALSLDIGVVGLAAAVAVALGLVTGALPAINAYRMRILDALSRR